MAHQICFNDKRGLKSSFNLRKMFPLDIFLINSLGFTKTIIPLALMTSESIAHSTFGLMGYWLKAHSGSRNNW